MAYVAKKCTKCDKTPSSQKAYDRHVKDSHGEKTHLCEYKECNWKFATKCGLDRHINGSHLKLKNFKCTVAKCDAKFFKKHDRANHIKFAHNNIRNFVCTTMIDDKQCGAKFHAAVKLRRHQEKHSSEKPYKCDKCSVSYKSNDGLIKHTNKIHLNILNHICDGSDCDYACSNSSDLKKHKKCCTNGKTGSFGEVTIKNLLDVLNIRYNYNTADRVMGTGSLLRWDFIILTDGKLGYCEPLYIEYDGAQHFKPTRFGGRTLEASKKAFVKQKMHDKLKDDFCYNEGYILLRIPYTQAANIEPLVKNFINTHTIGYF